MNIKCKMYGYTDDTYILLSIISSMTYNSPFAVSSSSQLLLLFCMFLDISGIFLERYFKILCESMYNGYWFLLYFYCCERIRGKYNYLYFVLDNFYLRLFQEDNQASREPQWMKNTSHSLNKPELINCTVLEERNFRGQWLHGHLGKVEPSPSAAFLCPRMDRRLRRWLVSVAQ